MSKKQDVKIRGIVAVLALGLLGAGCASENNTSTETTRNIEGARNEAPPEAVSAQKQAEQQMRARAEAQGQAYSQSMQQQQGAPR
ncbi:MAG: hypothetical protein OHK0029_28710 [Armatimonadaceae bacterium]